MGRCRQRCTYVIVVLMLMLTACGVERPDDVLSDAQMEDILYDYHIARAMAERVPYNETYKRVFYVDDVFRKHGITEAQFDSSMVWFARNPQAIADIYKRVNERLRSQRDRYADFIAERDKRPKTSPDKDSVDLWPLLRAYKLSGTPFDNKVSFAWPADSNYHANDTLRFTARLRYAGTKSSGQDTLMAPVIALQVKYKNDSTVSRWSRMEEAGRHVLSVSADTLRGIVEVGGFIYYPLQPEARALLIDGLSLMRYRADSAAVGRNVEPDSAKQTSPQSEGNGRSSSKDMHPAEIGVKKLAPGTVVKPVKMDSMSLIGNRR